MLNMKNSTIIEKQFIKDVIQPYWTPFIRSAEIEKEDEVIMVTSHLGVDKPWYCDSTGHLNAVELNLAFNQMMYVAIGKAISLKWIDELIDYDNGYFMKKYWPDFLITKVSSEFKSPLNVENFFAKLRIVNIKKSSQHIWFKLDLTAAPDRQTFSKSGKNTHAYSTMTLVIKDYKEVIDG